MPQVQQTNGNGKLIWYVLTTLTMLVIGLVGAWGHGVDNKILDNDSRLNVIERRLESFDSKLDWLIEERKSSKTRGSR